MLQVFGRCLSALSHKWSLPPQLQPLRTIGFFTNVTADDVWRAVTTVSNAGHKRGRSRGLMRRRDLNRGQQLGVGRKPMLWPGLTVESLRGRQVLRQQPLEVDPERAQRLLRLRQLQSARRAVRVTGLQRGWSGHSLQGQLLGAADPGEEADEVQRELASRVHVSCLRMKQVCHMSGVSGRVRSYSCLAVGGDGHGLVGVAIGRGSTAPTAVRRVLRRIVHKLVYVERCDGHTVHHDFFTRMLSSKIFVQRRPRGHGLECHRVIAAVCQRVGITDLYARIEGSDRCYRTVAFAFLLGLLRQRTHQQLADQKRLHLVEMQTAEPMLHVSGDAAAATSALASSLCLGRVLARPAASVGGARCDAQVPVDENTDFLLHVMEGKVPHLPPPWPPFYVGTRGYERHLLRKRHHLNHDQVRVRLLAEYGELRSFLADRYPECRASSHEYHPSEEQEHEEQEEEL